MKRFLSVLAAAGALFVLMAPVAWAHEEITPKTFPTGKPTFFTLTAANEEKVDLTKVTLNAPQGLAFGATTHEPPGWSVNRTDAQITWTGGTVKPDEFETWGYEIEGADQPGTLPYKVTLGFADGKSDDVEVDVKATGAAKSAAPGVTKAGAKTKVTTAKKAGAAKTAASRTSSSSGSSTTANVALGLGAAALVVSLVALALIARRPGPAAAPGGQRQDF